MVVELAVKFVDVSHQVGYFALLSIDHSSFLMYVDNVVLELLDTILNSGEQNPLSCTAQCLIVHPSPNGKSFVNFVFKRFCLKTN